MAIDTQPFVPARPRRRAATQPSGAWTPEELDELDEQLRRNPHAPLPGNLRRESVLLAAPSRSLPESHALAMEVLNDVFTRAMGVDFLFPRMVTRVDRAASAHDRRGGAPPEHSVWDSRDQGGFPQSPPPTHMVAFGRTLPIEEAFAWQGGGRPAEVYHFGDTVVHTAPIPLRPLLRGFLHLLSSIVDAVVDGRARAELESR